ncbi:MAG: hypothetical protein OEV66_06430 [Spirochaetia bacterium]|nr:hypothetical protein [Spirochaetia bacterium]
MRNTKFILSVIVAGFIVTGCGVYIKRTPPDTGFARAKIGEAIFSTSDFRLSNGEQRVVYKFWIFKKSDSKKITISYEENLDFIKLTPDIREEKTYSIGKDFTFQIQDMKIEIYELTASSIVYYIRQGR